MSFEVVSILLCVGGFAPQCNSSLNKTLGKVYYEQLNIYYHDYIGLDGEKINERWNDEDQ